VMSEESAPLQPAASPQAALLGRRERDAVLRQLVADHFDFVWRWLRRVGVPAADADDGAQRVFMVAADRLGDIRPGAERAFLRGVALRVAGHARRAQRRRNEDLEEDLAHLRWEAGPDVDEALATRDALRLLDALLDGMDLDLRETFVLFEVEEMTTAAIATLLELPEGTVKSRLRRAREDFGRRAARVRARYKKEGTS
jgi:RNA polymerase sigma-70 factor, ECF subfamily